MKLIYILMFVFFVQLQGNTNNGITTALSNLSGGLQALGDVLRIQPEPLPAPEPESAPEPEPSSIPEPIVTDLDQQRIALTLEMDNIIVTKFDTCNYAQSDISQYNTILQKYEAIVKKENLNQDVLIEYSQRPYRVELDCLIKIFDNQIQKQEIIDPQMVQAYERAYHNYDLFMQSKSLVIDTDYLTWLDAIKQHQVQPEPLPEPEQQPAQEPVQEDKTLISAMNIATGREPQFYSFEQRPVGDTNYKLGVIKTNGSYDVKVYGPQLVGNVYVEDFYSVQESAKHKEYEVVPEYPIDKIKSEEPIGKRIYTLTQGLHDELEKKRDKISPVKWADEKKKTWDWKTDSMRKMWLDAHTKGDVVVGGHKPIRTPKNNQEYFDNLKRMIEEQVLNVPHELKYVEYLGRVENLLNRKIKDYQNWPGIGQIEQFKNQVHQLKLEVEKETNWAMRKLLRQLLDKKYEAEAGQSALEKMLGQFGQQEGEDSDFDDDDSDWDD